LPPRGPVSAVAAAAGSGDLRIALWINANRIDLTDPVSFTLTVQNPNPIAVTGVKIARFSHDGFSEKDSGCWHDGSPICTETGEKLRSATMIPAQGSLQIAGTLVGDDSGRSVIGVLLSWNSSAGPRSKAVMSAPVTIEGRYTALGRGTRQGPRLAPRSGHPGISLQESRRVADAHARNVERHVPVEPHADREILDAALRYVLPDCCRIRSGDDGMAFFSLVRLWRQMFDVQREIGGFFLKTHVTEDLLSSIWNVIAIWSNLVFGHAREEAALTLETTAITYSDFEKHYASLRVFTKLREIHDGQSRNVIQLIATLAALMEQVLDFEMNRPYVNWYEDGPAPFDVDEFAASAAIFNSVREHFVSHELPSVSAASMKVLRDAMAEVEKGIRLYRTFVVSDQRRQYLGRVFAV
jgi:hypothetical protein